MIERLEQIKPFLDGKTRLIRVHYPKIIEGDVVVCSCILGAECPENHKGKHPCVSDWLNNARTHETTDTIWKNYNIGVITGHGFVVLDIDPRNGGDKKLAELTKKHGDLPETWTVNTGSGGLHYYFRVEGKLSSGMKLATKGVELRGVGGMVVAPGSLHKSGSHYEWEVWPDECEMGALPEWLIEECSVKGDENTKENDFDYSYDHAEIISALNAIDSNCSYQKWFEIACALVNSGMEFEVFDEWSAKGGDQYNESKARKQWNSITQKVYPYTARTIFNFAYEAGWEPPETVERWAFKEDESEQDNTYNEISLPPGVLGTLGKAIFESALFPEKSFAIAAAISVGSACAHGRFTTPTGANLNLYLFLILAAGGGKGHYPASVKKILSEVNPELTMGEPSSGQALRRILNERPARALVFDEGMRWLEDLSDTRNEILKKLRTDFLTVWSGGELLGLETKDSDNSTQSVSDPRVTIFGVGTDETLDKLITNDKAGSSDGFFSRLDFVIGTPETPDSFIVNKKLVLSEEIIKHLERVIGRETKAFDGANKCKAVVEPEKVPCLWTDEAANAWNKYAFDCHEAIKSGKPSSIYNRAAEKALRIASILACCETPRNPTITTESMAWAIDWQTRLTELSDRSYGQYMGKGTEGVLREKILTCAKQRQTLSRGFLKNRIRGWEAIPERVRNDALNSLVADGLLEKKQSRKTTVFLYKECVL